MDILSSEPCVDALLNYAHALFDTLNIPDMGGPGPGAGDALHILCRLIVAPLHILQRPSTHGHSQKPPEVRYLHVV